MPAVKYWPVAAMTRHRRSSRSPSASTACHSASVISGLIALCFSRRASSTVRIWSCSMTLTCRRRPRVQDPDWSRPAWVASKGRVALGVGFPRQAERLLRDEVAEDLVRPSRDGDRGREQEQLGDVVGGGVARVDERGVRSLHAQSGVGGERGVLVREDLARRRAGYLARGGLRLLPQRVVPRDLVGACTPGPGPGGRGDPPSRPRSVASGMSRDPRDRRGLRLARIRRVRDRRTGEVARSPFPPAGLVAPGSPTPAMRVDAARSSPRVVSVVAQPPLTSPTTSRSHTTASSRNTSLNSALPFICRNGRTSTPGWCMSSTNHVMPRCFGTPGSVRASSIPKSA